MSDEPFTLDTNILVYSIDTKAGDRQIIARRVIDQAIELDCRLTLQAVSEFYATVTRKQLLSRSEAVTVAEEFLLFFSAVPASPSAVRAALAASAAGRASYWDALLVATAAEAGCAAIATEDLADGAVLFGVRIVNPFAASSASRPLQQLLRL